MKEVDIVVGFKESGSSMWPSTLKAGSKSYSFLYSHLTVSVSGTYIYGIEFRKVDSPGSE